jgi:uncharacterized cupin superfamily protein
MADQPRSRFDNVIHRDAIPKRRWEEGERYGCDSWEAAVSLNAKDLGFCIVSLDPGRRSCPFHFHHSEEELFFVLQGEGVLRQGDAGGEEERITLGQGDFASFPPGTGIAHQFFNESDAPFVYLAFSNRLKHDVCEYPDSDKLLVRGTATMLRRAPQLEYLDGET